MSTGGKGDRYRDVDKDKFNSEFDRIFKQDKKKKEKERRDSIKLKRSRDEN